MADTPLSLRLLHRLDALGLAYGREDSFKIGPRRLVAERILVGVDTARANRIGRSEPHTSRSSSSTRSKPSGRAFDLGL